MTVMELVERDKKNAKINFLKAKERKGITAEELSHTEELWKLREKIFKVVCAAQNQPK